MALKFNKALSLLNRIFSTFLFFEIFCSLPAYSASVAVNVFAIPSENIENTVADVSSELKNEGMESFYAKGFPAHVTLYLTRFDEEKIPAILDKVQKLSATQAAIPLVANGFTVTAGNWVFVDAEVSHDLQRLADTVTLALEPMRDTTAPLPGWVNAYPVKKAAFERYGSPNVFQNFEPHMTLLAAEQSEALKAVAEKMKLKPPYAEGRVTAIGVGLADDKGQVSKVLKVYTLKQ